MTHLPASDDSHRHGDLEQAISILRRRAGVVVLCFVVTAGAAFGFSALQEKEYSASASLLFRNPGFARELFGTVAIAANPANEAATNERLVELRVVAEGTAERLEGLSADEISSMVAVGSEEDVDLVSVTATSPEPEEARQVANEFALEFIAFRARTDRETLQRAKRLAERELDRLSPEQQEGGRGEALSRGAERLGILASLQTGNAELVEPAGLPASPSAPQPMRNGILGGIVGLLLGIGLAFLVERLDRRLRDPEEASDIFGRPILTIVPATEALIDPERPLPSSAAEAFRMLRANLRYFNVDGEVRSVIVTSPQPGDGKSTVAWNLASAVAATEARTLLIEADLRHPTLGRWMHEVPRVGLSALLTSQGSLADAAVTVRFGEGNGEGDGGGPTHELDLIFAGPLPPNPDELMASERMRELVRAAERDYELVVIDTPPTSVVADAIPLVREASGVLVVARLDRTTRDAASGLAAQLGNLGARVLGVVVNHLRARRFGYGYGYGYGYYGYGDRSKDGKGARAGGKGTVVSSGADERTG